MSVFGNIRSFVGENSPTILTVMGVAGVAGTAICAAQAAVKSKEITDKIDNWDDYDIVEKAKVVVPIYIPAVAMGVATSAAIIGSNSVNLKRGAALTGAYALAEDKLQKYEDKVKETFGEKKANKIREDVAQEEVNQSDYDPEKVTITEDGNVALCYDSVSGRYFMSSIERLKRIEADLNAYMMQDGGYLSLNEFYDRIGLSDISIGDDLGWDINKNGLMDLHYDATISQDEKPCIVVNYEVKPKYQYYY